MKVKGQEEIIEQLEEKVRSYEAMLEESLGNRSIKIAKTIAGPIHDSGKNYYTVQYSEGGGEGIVTYQETIIFKDTSPKSIKIGTDVLIKEEVIVGIMPEKLKRVEELPVFNHVKWDVIGGLKSQIEDIRDAIELPIKHEKLSKEFGLMPIKGILLYGSPGCGKTLIGKAIASDIINNTKADIRAFTYVKGGEMLSKYVGESENRIVEMFKNARSYTKTTGIRSVIFIDEAEAILPRRGSRISSDVDSTIVPTFLAEMDGFDSHAPFILLSTNLPNSIDEAILREGRIDLKIKIDRPTQLDSEEILDIHFCKVKCHDSIKDLSKKAAALVFNSELQNRVSGSLLEGIVKISIQKAMKRKVINNKAKSGVVIKDVEEALKSLIQN